MEPNYRIIDSIEDISDIPKGPIVIDLETNSLVTHSLTTRIVGVGLAWEEGKAYYIPFVKWIDKKTLDISQEYNEELKRIERLILANPDYEIWGHNIKYDIRVLHAHGLSTNNVTFDLMIASYCLYSDRLSFQKRNVGPTGHSLDDICLHNLNFLKIRTKHIIGKKKRNEPAPTMLDAPVEECGFYCMEDVDYTLRGIHRLRDKLEESGNEHCKKLFYEIEMPVLAKVLIPMECNGVKLDTGYIQELIKDFSLRKKEALRHVSSIAGEEIGDTIPRPQLERVIYDELKVQDEFTLKTEKTPSGARPTDANTLEKMQEHPFIEGILTVKALHKLISTYLEPLLKGVDTVDGLLHGELLQHIAPTGRLSCVPLDSEILTAAGWKTWDQISSGEEVVGFDLQSRSYCWTHVRNVHRGRGKVGLIKTNAGHDSKYHRGFLCTKEHKWVVENPKVVGFRRAGEVARNFDTLISVRAEFPETDNCIGLSPTEAAIWGWYLTGGFLTGGKGKITRYGLGISLCKKSSIKALQDLLLEIKHSHKVYPDYNGRNKNPVNTFHIGCNIFDPIYRKVLLYSPGELPLFLSPEARKSMLRAMLEADGSRRKGSNRYDRFRALRVQDKKTPEYFEALLVAEGIPFNSRTTKLASGKEFVHYDLTKREVLADRNYKWKPLKEVEVWCPETDCGTWVIRQNNRVAITGNSRNPNLQNIPQRLEIGRQVRKAFVSRFEGGQILSADWGQCEIRIITHISKEQVFIDIFNRDGDPHLAAGALINGVPEEEVTPEMRTEAKTLNFGILYLMGPKRLAQETGKTQEEAAKLISLYLGTMKGLDRCIKEQKEKVQQKGYTETLLGRRRYIPKVFTTIKDIPPQKPKWLHRHTKEAALRESWNNVIQGSNSDICKMATIQVQDWLRDNNMKSVLCLQVHDELVLDVHPDEIDLVKPAVEKIMSEVLELVVPLVCEGKYGDNWKEAH